MKHKKNTPFFLTTSIGNLDNLVDLSDEEPPTFDKVEDALSAAKDCVQEYDLQTYIYKCVPVFRIKRGKTRITKL